MQGEEDVKRDSKDLREDIKQSFENLKQDLEAYIFPFLDQHRESLDDEHKRKLQLAKDYCKYRKSIASYEEEEDVPSVECTSTAPGKNDVLGSRYAQLAQENETATCAVTPVCQAFTDRASFIQACEDIANALSGTVSLRPVDHLRILSACFTAVLYRPDLLEKNQFLALKFTSLEALSDLLKQALIECKDLDVERYIERAQTTLKGHTGKPYTVVRVTLEKSVFDGQTFGNNLVAEGYLIHPAEGRHAFTVGVLPEAYK